MYRFAKTLESAYYPTTYFERPIGVKLVFAYAIYNDQRPLDRLNAVYWLMFSSRLLSITEVLRAPVLYVFHSVLVVLQVRRSVQSSPFWLYRKRYGSLEHRYVSTYRL